MLKPKAPYVVAHWSALAEGFTTSSQAFYRSVEAAVEARQLANVTFSRVLWKEGGVASAEREYLRVQRGRLAFDICAAPHGNGYFFSSWLARVPYGSALLWLAFFLTLGFAAVTVGTMVMALVDQVTNDSSIGCSMMFYVALFIVLGIPIALGLLGLAIHQGHFMDEELVLSMPWVGALYAWVFNPLTYYRLDTALMFQKSVHNAVMEAIDGLHAERGMRALGPDERKATVRDFAK